MTFSVILRDPNTGEFGSAISSSSPAVAARCLNLGDGVGGANSQNVTDPRLGLSLMERLRAGAPAHTALSEVLEAADPPTLPYRQLLVLDRCGRSAAFSGGRALGVAGDVCRQDVVAGGNMLADLDVLDSLVDTAVGTRGRIEERLLAALQAAVAAGGEAGPVHSAGLVVVGDAGWPVTDLRIDWAERDPVGALGELLDRWLPERDDYVERGRSPALAPSYGVPGDE